MAFSYKATLTVTSNSSLLPSTQSNYPLWVDITDNSLKLVANGGSVTDAAGDDVVPYSDSGLSSQLTFEIEDYNGSTGRWRGWVLIPSLSLGLVFYMGIGNAAITTSQDNENAVWAGFEDVYHLGDTIVGSRGHDSTANANHGTALNTSDETGLLNTALGFNGSTASVSTPITDLSFASGTISCWAKPSSAFNDGMHRVMWGQYNPATSNVFDLEKFSDGNFNAGWQTPSGDDRASVASTGTTYPNGQWVYYEVTWVNGGNTILRADGVQLATQGSLDAITNVDDPFYAGRDLWFGHLDELRISSVVRSQDWGVTDTNSQGDPATFISSSFASVGPAPTPQLRGATATNLRWR